MAHLATAFFKEVADISQLLEALEHLPGPLFMIKNLDSRYIYMSPVLRESINLSQGQDVVGKSDFDLFPKAGVGVKSLPSEFARLFTPS